MNELVKIVKNVPVVSTLDMWESLGVEHSALIRMIRKYDPKFQKIRTFGFEIQKSGGRPTAFCYLDEHQATALINLMKNSDIVVDFKFRLVEEFYRMKNLLREIASQKQNAEWLPEVNIAKCDKYWLIDLLAKQ
jgi:phage regulator Rha-like protein